MFKVKLKLVFDWFVICFFFCIHKMKIDTENTLVIYKISKNQFKILRETVCFEE